MLAEQIAKLKEFDARHYVSKLIFDSERMRVALFCLKAGQELPAHTAASEVLFYCVEGEGEAQVGQDWVALSAGSLVDCAPQVAHGLRAKKDLVVLAMIAPRP